MDKAQRPAPDAVLSGIADFVVGGLPPSAEAFETARYCLMDSLGCGLLALGSPSCARLLGPLVPGGQMEAGARVPGTAFQLDPVQAAFDIGCMVRWLDFNDTWLAAEWGHPSDNLGGLLATADYLSRQQRAEGRGALSIQDLLIAMIKAYEIQGVLALENSFNELGLDHVLLVRIATSAVVAHLLGGSREQVISAVSNAWLDGGTLRLYRHAPNVGPRKGWAAGDATSRGVWLALMARQGEPGYPNALTAETWGFYAVFCDGQALRLPRPYGCYVMENILFKVAYPAEFHAQTAVEAAVALHSQVVDRLGEIETITLETQRPGMRIINKVGPLDSPADRDHCLQYTVAVALLFGRLTATDYEDEVAADPRIDALRGKMTVTENACFTQDYYDPERRAIGNAVQVFFNDGTRSERLEVNYPLGHRQRRSEALPKLWHKFDAALSARLNPAQTQETLQLFQEPERLEATPVDDLMARLATPGHGPG